MTAPITYPAYDSAPSFWDRLPAGHKLALFAAPFAVVGGLGPWAVATRVEMSIASRSFEMRTLYGYEREGWLIALAALFAMASIMLVKDPQRASSRALAALSFAALLAGGEWLADGLLLSFNWEAPRLLWGPAVATLGALVGAGGALWGSRDATIQ